MTWLRLPEPHQPPRQEIHHPAQRQPGALRLALLFLPGVPPLALTLRPLLIELSVIAIFWIICLWLYLRGIFLKV